MNFLREKVDEIFGNHARELHEIIVVLPSKRAVLFFLKFLSERAPKGTIAPDVMTIDEFFSRIAGSEITDYSKLLLTLLKVARQRVPDRCKSLSEFMSWGPQLLNDFNVIDEHLIEPDQILRNATRALLLEQWNPDSAAKKGPLEEKFEKFYDALYDLYTDFTDYLDQNNYNTRGSIYRKAAENIRSNNFFFRNKVYFLGFNALTGSEQDVVRNLIKAGRAEFIGDFDSYYCTRLPSHEAGTFYKKLIKSGILSDRSSMTDILSTDQKLIVHHHVSGSVEQTNVLAHLVQNMQAQGRTDYTNVAVVLPDESMLFPLLNYLPKIDSGINVTIQLPLEGLPLYQWIVSYINTLEFASRKQMKGKFYYRHLVEIFSNPLSYRYFDFLKVNSLLTEIKRKNIIFLSGKEIRDKLGLTESSIFTICNSPQELIHSAGILLEQGIKNSLNFPLFETEQMFMIREVLNQLKEDIAEWPQDFFSIKEIPIFLKGISNSYGVSLKGEPVEGLQVMGMLETRLLNFDVVIILSSIEDTLPKSPDMQSIIPHDIAHAHGIPDYRHRQAVISYHFYQLVRNSKEVHLISFEPALGYDQTIPSRFIFQCKWELASLNSNITFKEIQYSQPLYINRHHGTFRIKKDSQFQSDLRLKLSEKGISPTDLANYIERPKDFYMRYLLGIRDTEEVVEELDSKVSGTVIHETLKELYQPFVNLSFPSENELHKLRKTADSVLMHHLTKNFPHIDWSKGKNYLSMRIARQMIINQIDSDLKRVKNHNKSLENRTIRFLEYPMQTTININLKSPVKLHGIIDRIDEESGTYYIIDYKTGKIFENQPAHYDLSNIDFSDKEKRVRAGKPLQLICYMIMLANHMGTSGTYRYNASLHFIRYGGENQKYLFKEKNSNKFDLNNTDLYYFNSEDIEQCKEIVVAILNEILDIDGVENQYLEEL